LSKPEGPQAGTNQERIDNAIDFDQTLDWWERQGFIQYQGGIESRRLFFDQVRNGLWRCDLSLDFSNHVLGTKPDLKVTDNSGRESLVFLDGDVHKNKQSNDKELRGFLRDCGYHVIEIGHGPYTNVSDAQIIGLANQVVEQVKAQWRSLQPSQSNRYPLYLPSPD
jgi:hypothetical protein|tara:strand:+ start:276 stop:773 length:498 start_codon:yes stop_codon:yes gene_type:complete